MAFDDEFSGALVVGGNPDVTVYEATDRTGRAVVVVVMTPVAASLRPRQREAFVVAASDAAAADGPAGAVVAVDVDADRPWVAVTSPPGLVALRDILATVHTSPGELLPGSEGTGTDGEAPEDDATGGTESRDTAESAAELRARIDTTRPEYPLPGMPRRPVTAVWGMIAAAVLLSVVAVTAFHVVWQPESESTPPSARATTVPSLDDNPFVSPSRIPPPPVLRRVPPVRLVGPLFGPKDTTQVVHPRELPFAYRVPASWDCGRGNILPGGVGYFCDADTKAGVARVTVFVRRCRAVCTRAERDRFGQDWMDAPVTYRERDATTQLADVSGAGYYRLAISHLFRDSAGKLTWHVGVFARATPAYTATVQKVVNDIRSQTP